LVVTSDLPEALNLADELLVMRQGHLEGRLVGDQMTEERVIRMALGYSAEAECHAVDH
jgi:ribose transport system ATP-binding protein